ncbi:transposase, MuDR, plant [Tanacetum coccineum]
MAYSSSSSSYLIRFHRGGVFVRDPFSYDYEMLSEIPNVDLGAINFIGFVKLLVSECSSDIKQIFCHVAGLLLELGLRTLKSDEDLAKYVELGAQNDNVLDIYVSHSVFEFFDATSNSKQQVGNDEHNDDSDSDLDDVYVYDSESEESETASVDHLSDGEEEVYDARTKKPDTAPKKMFDANFLSRIYNGLPRDEYGEKDVSDEDNLSDQWPVHDPTKLMRRVLGKKYESPEQLKRALKTIAKKIMMNPCIKVKEIIESILKKYKCKVKISQARRGKMKALHLYETCLEDHYGMLWSYASEILSSIPGLTCKMSVDSMPDGKNYFSRRVIGLDGCFLKTICKGELLSAVGRDGNYQMYLIAWDVGIIEAAKQVMPLAEHRQCARHIYANFRKKYTRVQYRNLFWKAAKATYPTRFNKVMKEIQTINKEAYKHLMDIQPETWSRSYFSTDNACDAVKNGISECFNAMIVDARRKPIINMLKESRLKKYKDLHREWKVILSGESRFEVRNGYEGFKVDKRSRSCSCRGWQSSGIPCEHGIVAIYFLHKDAENYVSDWYNKDAFVNAYNHYIAGMNGMGQWPTTDYQKPLPRVVRRMPERAPHKRKRDAIEDDGNRTRISRKGQLNHCTLCKKPGHNQRACSSKPEVTTAAGEIVTASVGEVTAAGKIVTTSGGNVTSSGDLVSTKGGNVTARGGKVCARGGKVTARGGIMMASRGNVTARGRKVTVSGGKVTARGGKVSAKGGKVAVRGGKATSTPPTPSTPPSRFEMSTPNTASSAVRTSGGGIKLRECSWIRSPKKERSSYAHTGSSSINKLRTTNGKNSMGLPRHAWPEGITPQDCIIHAATQFEIALSHSQPVESQEEEPRKEEPRNQEPRQQQPRQ